MPRFTLSTLVAVAIISSKVFAQNTTTTTSALTPLASKHFDYNNLVRSVITLIFSNVIPNPVRHDSHTKLTRTTVFVAPNPVTTGATRPRRTRSPSARLPLLTPLMVFSALGAASPPTGSHQLIFRLLPVGTSEWSHHHRRDGTRRSRLVHQARSWISSHPRWCPQGCSVHENSRLRSGCRFHRPEVH